MTENAGNVAIVSWESEIRALLAEGTPMHRHREEGTQPPLRRLYTTSAQLHNACPVLLIRPPPAITTTIPGKREKRLFLPALKPRSQLPVIFPVQSLWGRGCRGGRVAC